MPQFGHVKRSMVLHAARPDGYAACNMMLKLTHLRPYDEAEGWRVCHNRACRQAQHEERVRLWKAIDGDAATTSPSSTPASCKPGSAGGDGEAG